MSSETAVSYEVMFGTGEELVKARPYRLQEEKLWNGETTTDTYYPGLCQY